MYRYTGKFVVMQQQEGLEAGKLLSTIIISIKCIIMHDRLAKKRKQR